MEDMQSRPDTRNIKIDQVGIRGIRYPITLLDKQNITQHSIASINMYISLPEAFKGTHMSRFLEILNECHNDISHSKIVEMLKKIRKRLSAKEAYIELFFPYFLEKSAPVSGQKSLMSYDCAVIAKSNKNTKIDIQVKVPVTTLCPCSKAISDRGAHNQRGFITIRVSLDKFVWIEDLILIAEQSASCSIWPLLKRPDEKYATDKAYNNPMFVEDIVRDIAKSLNDDERINSFKIEVENMESIHTHNAYALIKKGELIS